MSVERLTQISSHVMVAHAVKTWSAWNPQHTMINTYTQFAVDSWLKGQGQSTVTVKQPGGSSEGYTQHVAGVKPWSAGESAVLFLQRAPSNDGTFVVTGLVQGNFRVRRSASGEVIADNGVPGSGGSEPIDSYNSAAKSVAPYSGSRIQLDELERRVRAAVQTR
jgi:hypothetical protein